MADRSVQRGYTLMEALLALVILGIVTAFAVPSFGNLLSERRVSAGARALASSLLKAQAEATARNRNVEVLFTTSDPTPLTVTTATATAASTARRWMVRQTAPVDTSAFIDGYSLITQAPTVAMDATANSFAFTPLGRPVTIAGGAVTPLAAPVVVRFTDAGTAARRFCTYLTTGGAIRVCDPLLAAGKPQACQPQLAAGAC